MVGRVSRRAAAAGATVATLCAGGSAWADADLVIVQRESVLEAGSCERSQPLATGRIVIQNIGDTRARVRGALVGRFASPILAVYVPEHLDLIDRAYELRVLQPLDAEGIRIRVGRNRLKAGRFTEVVRRDPGTDGGGGGEQGPPQTLLDESAVVDPANLVDSQRVAYQQALARLGFFEGEPTGAFDARTVDAIAAYQRSRGEAPTGRITVGQALALDAASGVYLALGGAGTDGAGSAAPEPTGPVTPLGPTTTYRIVLYAVVDPFNIVRESDESNNLVRFPIEITCRE